MLLAGMLMVATEAIVLQPLPSSRDAEGADLDSKDERRPWHPRLAFVNMADGSVGLQMTKPTPLPVQLPPTLLQVGQSSNSPGSCECERNAPTKPLETRLAETVQPAAAAVAGTQPQERAAPLSLSMVSAAKSTQLGAASTLSSQ